MTARDVELRLLELEAAFPRPAWDDTTRALYAGALSRMDDRAAAADAVRGLVSASIHRPRVAELERDYRIAAKRNADERARTRGLAEPEPDWPSNAAAARELADRLKGAA